MYASYVPQHLTDPLWQRLAHSKLFITGGTGLFGHWLLDSLTDANNRLNLKIEATVLTRNPEKAQANMPHLDERIIFIRGDVESFELPTGKFDAILHMATTSAEETFQGFNQTHKLRMLFEGTQRVLELAKKSGSKRILFTSSGAVYGNQLCDRIQETAKMHTDPLRAESGLALGKCVAEFLLSQASNESGLEVVIARCFSFVGPGIPINLHYAVGNFINNVIEGKPIIIKGDGSAIRSYMFMGDLIYWLLKLLLDGKSGEAYNVGSDKAISIFELAQLVSELVSPSSKIVVLGQAGYTVGVPIRDIYVPSINKAFNHLDLHIYTELKKSLTYTCDSFRKIR